MWMSMSDAYRVLVDAALFLLPLAVAGLGYAVLSRRARREAGALRAALAQQDALVAELRSQVTALIACSKGLGDRVQDHQANLRRLAERQTQIERDESNSRFRSAAALVERGAAVDELVERCGLSRGEAELVQHLKNLQGQSLGQAA